MRAIRTALFVTTIVAAALLIQAAGAAHDLAEPLEVTSVVLVSSEADGDFVTETYRATLHHSGPPGARDFAQVSATLIGAAGLSVPGFIEVVDGNVAFGTIRAGETSVPMSAASSSVSGPAIMSSSLSAASGCSVASVRIASISPAGSRP